MAEGRGALEAGTSLLELRDDESVAQSSNQVFAAASAQSTDVLDFVRQHEKSAFRSVWCLLLISVMFAIPAPILLVLFGSQSDSLTYDGWRLSYQGLRTDWRVCYLELLDSNFNPVSLEGARVISSTPIPEDFNISSHSCSRFWSSNATDAYIGVILSQDMDIHGIRIGHPTEVTSCSTAFGCWIGCVSPSSCASCCLRDESYFLPDKVTVQRLGSSEEWIDTNPDQHVDQYVTLVKTFPEGTPINWAKWIYFVVGLFCATLALILIIASPIQYYMARQLRQRLISACEELERGTAMVLSYGHEQWQAFVENEWGPGGREEKANSLLMSCIAFPILACFGLLILYTGSRKKHPDEGLSLPLCAAIIVPLAFLLTIGIYPLQKCRVKRTYGNLQNRPQSAMLASTMLTFGNVLLFKSDLSKKLLDAQVLEGLGAEGALLCVKYQVKSGKTKVQKLVRIPLPHDRTQEVKSFITQHAGFYNPSASLMSEVFNACKTGVKVGKLAHALVEAAHVGP